MRLRAFRVGTPAGVGDRAYAEAGKYGAQPLLRAGVDAARDRAGDEYQSLARRAMEIAGRAQAAILHGTALDGAETEEKRMTRINERNTEPAARWLASEWVAAFAQVVEQRTGTAPRLERLESASD